MFALTVAIGGDFIQTLTPEKIRAAGLNKLTPEELTQLDDLIQQYKTGASVPVPSVSAVQVDKAESKQAKPIPAWVGALLTLEKAGSKADRSDALESQLAGSFSGWNGQSTFILENGQHWIQVNPDSYSYAPTLKNPKVKIYPASFGSFWLEVEGVNKRCRVKLLKLE